MSSVYKELGELIEKEYIKNIENAIADCIKEVEGFEDCRRSANLQAVLTMDEYKDYEDSGLRLTEMVDEMIALYDECKYLEAVSLYHEMVVPSDKMNGYYEEVVRRIESDEVDQYLNINYLVFINKFGDSELRFDYWETMDVVMSPNVWYVSWLDSTNTRRFISCGSKIDAMQVAMSEPGLGKNNIYCKMLA